jgi:hypothetical protein
MENYRPLWGVICLQLVGATMWNYMAIYSYIKGHLPKLFDFQKDW